MTNGKTDKTESYKPDILYISGSPRSHTSEALIALIERGAKAVGGRAHHFFLSNKRIAPCTGCGTCTKNGTCTLANKTARDRLIDDYLEFHGLIERVDALVIVAPIYFSGPSAQYKALLDRLQPYWAKRYVLGQEPRTKRPAQLYVIGAGGDPHGHAPLVGITKSALAVAGFNLEKTHSFVGFKAKEDVPVMPSEDKREHLTRGEIAQLRHAVAAQADFEQRATNAGGAFARYLQRINERNTLTTELEQVEAEIAAFKADGAGVDSKQLGIDQAFEELRGSVAGVTHHKTSAETAEAVAAAAEAAGVVVDGAKDKTEKEVVGEAKAAGDGKKEGEKAEAATKTEAKAKAEAEESNSESSGNDNRESSSAEDDDPKSKNLENDSPESNNPENKTAKTKNAKDDSPKETM